jgi:hypothetical protein
MKKIVFSAAIVLIAAFASAQKVGTQLNFTKGSKIEVTTTINVVAQLMGEITTNATTTRILDVEDVNNNVATIESKIKRMQFSFEGMGQSQTFDSENESDMKGEGGKMAEKGLKNKYTMKVESNGTIIEVTPDDDNPNAKKDDAADATDPMMGMMEGGSVGGLDLPKVGSKIELAVFPQGDMARGDTWSDTTTLVPGMTRKAIYTIKDITNDMILVNFTEESSGKLTRQNMGMEITIDQTDKTTGSITIDRASGLIKERNLTKKSEGTMEVMGQTMPLDTTTTIKETVTVSK